MNQSRYLPNGFVSSLNEQETKLVNTVAGITYKRRIAGKPAIRRLHSFSLQLLQLAANYKQLRDNQKAEATGGPRLKQLASAALDLQMAFQGLRADEIQALVRETRECESEGYGTQSDDSALRLTHAAFFEWLQTRALVDLQSAASKMASPRSRGRQPLAAERWAALEFVRLCHSEGWSNIQVANGGSESSNGQHASPSDAVICLAAIFALDDTAPARSVSMANTVLRSLRKGARHTVLHTYGDDDQAYEEHEQYEISLKASISDSIRLLNELPDFIPKSGK